MSPRTIQGGLVVEESEPVGSSLDSSSVRARYLWGMRSLSLETTTFLRRRQQHDNPCKKIQARSAEHTS